MVRGKVSLEGEGAATMVVGLTHAELVRIAQLLAKGLVEVLGHHVWILQRVQGVVVSFQV